MKRMLRILTTPRWPFAEEWLWIEGLLQVVIVVSHPLKIETVQLQRKLPLVTFSQCITVVINASRTIDGFAISVGRATFGQQQQLPLLQLLLLLAKSPSNCSCFKIESSCVALTCSCLWLRFERFVYSATIFLIRYTSTKTLSTRNVWGRSCEKISFQW